MKTMKHTKPKRKTLPRLAVLILAVGLFAAGFFSGRSSIPLPPALSERSCSVRYLVDGKVYDSISVVPGARLPAMDYPTLEDLSVLAWTDANGLVVDPRGYTVYTDMDFVAITAPALERKGGYMPCPDGLFRPETPVSSAELLEIFRNLALSEPDEALFETRDSYSPDELAALLNHFFRAEKTEDAVERIRGMGSEEVSRAECAVVLNALLGLEGGDGAYFPDIEEDYWAAESAALAGIAAHEQKLEPGFVNLSGWLYCVEDNGYFLKNGYIGSLYFDQNGRYTSGDAEMDVLVAAAIAENTSPDMEREEMLRTMYTYVRDNFKYLRRNYYDLGENHWALEEAAIMYETGHGNCYNYAAAFWAAARGLGYDAMTVSGSIGSDRSRHGWVEIPIDGERYVFDVEIEMAYIRDGKNASDMFMMPHLSARYAWLYLELIDANAAAPREPAEIHALR